MDKSIDITNEDIYKEYERYVRNEPKLTGDLTGWMPNFNFTEKQIEEWLAYDSQNLFSGNLNGMKNNFTDK